MTDAPARQQPPADQASACAETAGGRPLGPAASLNGAFLADASRPVPLTVVMITRDEVHNMAGALDNLKGFAAEVVVVDSYSRDATVDIALARGARVIQRRFRGFGEQWNFALEAAAEAQPWTMKLDPDERLTEPLKLAIRAALAAGRADALILRRRLWFMGRPLPVRQDVLRVWRTGRCRFPDVLVNEHPLAEGRAVRIAGDLEHHDSPTLHHWLEKQNAYTTAEALAAHRRDPPATEPRLFAGSLALRMWLKRALSDLPGFPLVMHAYCLFWCGAWRAGRPGFAWARLRGEVYRWRAYKLAEMRRSGQYGIPDREDGPAHPRAEQAAADPRRDCADRNPPGVTFHEPLAPGWDARYRRDGFARRAAFVRDMVMPRVTTRGAWLDVGCGSGFFSRMLAERDAHVTGVDGSSAMVAEAERLGCGSAGLTFRRIGNAESLPFADASFDGVLCLSLLEYLERPTACLMEMARVLRPGGWLVLSTPCPGSPVRLMARLSRTVRRSTAGYPGWSRRTWSREALRGIAASHGFKVCWVSGFDPVLPRPFWTLAPSLTFAVLRKL